MNGRHQNALFMKICMFGNLGIAESMGSFRMCRIMKRKRGKDTALVTVKKTLQRIVSVRGENS